MEEKTIQEPAAALAEQVTKLVGSGVAGADLRTVVEALACCALSRFRAVHQSEQRDADLKEERRSDERTALRQRAATNLAEKVDRGILGKPKQVPAADTGTVNGSLDEDEETGIRPLSD